MTGSLMFMPLCRAMNDADGPRVARAIYTELLRGGLELEEDDLVVDLNTIAYALDDVVQEMRAEGLPPSRWTQFTHYGI